VRIADWPAGKAEARRLLQGELALGRRYRVAEVQELGERVTWRWASLDDRDRLLGLPPLEGTGAAVVRGGRITSLVPETDSASVRSRNAALDAALAAQARQTAAGATQAAADGATAGSGHTRPGGSQWGGAPLGAGLALGAAALAGTAVLASGRHPPARPHPSVST